MQEQQETAQHRVHGRERGRGGVALDSFQIKIAVIPPEEIVEERGRGVEFVVFVSGIQFLLHGVQLGEDIDGVGGGGGAASLSGLHLPEAAGVPEFVGEIASFLDLTFVKFHVRARGRNPHDAEAQAVRSVGGDQVQRIGRIPQRLGHLASLFVADDAGEIDIFKWHITHPFIAGHDHAGDPEEDNVRTGY